MDPLILYKGSLIASIKYEAKAISTKTLKKKFLPVINGKNILSLTSQARKGITPIHTHITPLRN